jgi:hypothetical protein
MHPEDVREYGYIAAVRSGSTSTTPCVATTRLRPHALYVDLAVRRDYSSLGCSGSTSATPSATTTRLRPLLISGRTRSTSTSPCAVTTRLRPHALYVDLAVRRDYSSPAARVLHRLRRALRVLVSRLQRLYVNLAVRHEYSSPGCSGSTSTTPRIRVPRHVAWLVTRLVAPLVVDYSASRRLVVDYFASAARPGASACRAARHAARRATRR